MCKECGVKYEPITSATVLKQNIFRNATGACNSGDFGTASEYGWDSEAKMEEKQSSPEAKFNEDDTYYRSVMSFGQPFAPSAAPTALPPHSPAASGKRWTPNGVASASPARRSSRRSFSSRSTSELEYSDSDSKEDEEEKKEEIYSSRPTLRRGGIMKTDSKSSTRSSSPPPPPYDSSRNFTSTPSPRKKRGSPQSSPPAMSVSIPPPTYPPSSPQHGSLPSPVSLPTPPSAYPPASHRGVPHSASAGSRAGGASYRTAAIRVTENRRRQHAPAPISMNTPPPFTRNPESPLVADGERRDGADGMSRPLRPNPVQLPSPRNGPGESKRRIEYNANTPIMNIRMSSPSPAAATGKASLPPASGGQPSGAGFINRVDSSSSTSSGSQASQQQHQDDAASGDGGTLPSPAKRPPPSSVTSTNDAGASSPSSSTASGAKTSITGASRQPSGRALTGTTTNGSADTENPTITAAYSAIERSRSSALGHPAGDGGDISAGHDDVASDFAHALPPSDSGGVRSKSIGGIVGSRSHASLHDSVSSLPASGRTSDKSGGSSKRSESARRFSFRRNKSIDASSGGGRVASFLNSLREKSAGSSSIEDKYSVRNTSAESPPSIEERYSVRNLPAESPPSIEETYSVRRTSMPNVASGEALGTMRSGGVGKSTRRFGRSRSFGIGFGSAGSKASDHTFSEQEQQHQQAQEESTATLGPSPSVTMTPARFRGHRGPHKQGEAEEEHRSAGMPPSVTMTPARFRGGGGAMRRRASTGTPSRSAIFMNVEDPGCDASAASTSSLSSSSTTTSTPIRARLKSYRRSLGLKRSNSMGGEGAGGSGRDPYTIDETKPSTPGVLLPSLAEYSQNDGAGGGGGADGHPFNGANRDLPVAKAVGSGVFRRNSKILARTRSYGGETSHSLAMAPPVDDDLERSASLDPSYNITGRNHLAAGHLVVYVTL